MNIDAANIVAACIGAGLPIIAKFIVDMFVSKRKLDAVEVQAEFAMARKAQQEVITDLQKQIFDLREEMVGLHRENIVYVKENADLLAKVTILTSENEALKKEVARLASEIKTIKND